MSPLALPNQSLEAVLQRGPVRAQTVGELAAELDQTRADLQAALRMLQENQDTFVAQFPIRAKNLVKNSVTTLPVKAPMYSEITFAADEANGVYWRLMFDGKTPYPWKKVGGPLLMAAGGSPTTASSTYQTTSQPLIVLPLAGDYDIEFVAQVTNNTAEDNQMRLGLFAGATEKESAILRTDKNGNGPIENWLRATALSKGASINVQYRSDSAKSATFFTMRLRIDPVRVG